MRAMSASRRVDGSSLQLFNADSSLAFTLKLFSAASILNLGDEHSLHLQLTFFSFPHDVSRFKEKGGLHQELQAKQSAMCTVKDDS